MTWVIDASVAIKWVVPEVLSDRADRLRAADDDLLAPDLLLVEAANALGKKTAANELSAGEADSALELLRQSGIEYRGTAPLLTRAMDLARRLGHPVYDCVYLALAEQESARFVTADRRLLRTAAGRNVQIIDLRTL